MASNKRLQIEAKRMLTDPPENVFATPSAKDLLVWYFIVFGPNDTPYEGGEYIGRIRFPPNYPFAPPGFQMLTPSGRFQPDAKICLSMSDFHPETWNPAWNVGTMLVGLLSFMVSEDIATGAIKGTEEERKAFAKNSHEFNSKLIEAKGLFDKLKRPTISPAAAAPAPAKPE